MLVVGIGTMAMIIVLSVFNGLEDLLRKLYGGFDPDIIVMPAEGKSFLYDEEIKTKLSENTGVAIITEVIEDNTLIKYKNSQRVVRMKGVSENYLRQGRIDRNIVIGEAKLKEGDINYAIIGRGIQYDLSINTNNDFYTIQLYYPRDIGPGVVDPSRFYTIRHAIPAGVFAIEKFYDENYIFVPVSLASSLLGYGNKRTALEIKVGGGKNANQVKSELSEMLGKNFKVILGVEQHADLYKILRIEKLFVFIIFSLVIGIASINIYFSLTMLVIEKKKDIAILKSQGASSSLIRKIFLYEGVLIAFIGSITGMALGLGLSFLQQYYGFISMGMQTTIMDAYPVKVEGGDVLLACITIVIITVLASVQPANKASSQPSLSEL